jgi:hypothetical protein
MVIAPDQNDRGENWPTNRRHDDGAHVDVTMWVFVPINARAYEHCDQAANCVPFEPSHVENLPFVGISEPAGWIGSWPWPSLLSH